MSDALLKVEHLTRAFGGLVAVNDVSFAIRPGEIVGLIGPNGAGKTTVFNLLVGIYAPTRGTIALHGEPVAAFKPHRIAERGMTKTFQNVALFMESTVLDNVITGGLLHNGLPEARKLARQVLKRVGLERIAEKRAADLSFPERARVEVARALCTQPKLLLLDEVMAALTPVEMEEVIALVRGLREEGITFIVVEHHMKAVMKLCERLLVLNFGQLIADGTPEQISRNPRVIEAYLGTSYAKAHAAAQQQEAAR